MHSILNKKENIHIVKACNKSQTKKTSQYMFIAKGNTCRQYGEEQLLHFLVKDVMTLPSTDKPKLACWHITMQKY